MKQTMSDTPILTLLKESSYSELTDVNRSPFWRQQFEVSDPQKWFYNHEKSNSDYNELILVVKIPKDVVGHKGIAHGGFVAMLIDEALCFCAYPVLPHKTGVTASLSISYLAPTPSGQWALLRAVAESKEGSRKATVKASLYPIPNIDASIDTLPWNSESASKSAEATQVVVEPKWYSQLTHQ